MYATGLTKLSRGSLNRVFLLITASLLLLPQFALAQDAESLRTRIEEHYTAIHAADSAAVVSHHLPEFSIFPMTGHTLLESGFSETAARMGADISWLDTQVTMKHFSAQLYGNVGIAVFYLDGSYGVSSGTWRVTAVWVWQDGEWKEAHHHESRLVS